MFVAHLPAGYLLTRAIQSKMKVDGLLWLGLVASVLPDIDILYFYLIDNRQTLHHEYFTHLPLFWLAVTMLVVPPTLIFKKRKIFAGAVIFLANIFFHLILDTFAGGIAWFYPFIDTSYSLVTVPATHDWWVWSFIFHWSFLLELSILVAAGVFLYRDFHKGNKKLIKTT